MSDALAHAITRAIRAERARTGLTQSQVAAALGWSRQVVTKIETGERPLLLQEVPALCRALGCTLADLLARAPQEDLDAIGL